MSLIKKTAPFFLMSIFPFAVLFCDTSLVKSEDVNIGVYKCLKGHYAPFGDGWCKEIACPFYRSLPDPK